ncbi:MAG: DoxX family protein [Gemmatimonadales bacterium]|nr:DoxX family protein [Myxococcales bacterium]
MTPNPIVQSKRRRVAATVTTGLFAAMMTISGVLYIVGIRPVQEGIHALGYPDYFMRFLGLAKLLGAAALVAPRMPRLREWAYAGFAFDLIGALVSHAATGTLAHAAPAAISLALLASSFLLRSPAIPHHAVRGSIWFSRAVLALAALLLTRIALGIVVDPVGTLGRRGFSFSTPDALTAMRVSGGIMLAIAAVLVYCLFSNRRLLAGLGLLAAVTVAILAVRLLGLALDGPGPFTLRVLTPEIVLVALASGALLLERRRAQPVLLD